MSDVTLTWVRRIRTLVGLHVKTARVSWAGRADATVPGCSPPSGVADTARNTSESQGMQSRGPPDLKRKSWRCHSRGSVRYKATRRTAKVAIQLEHELDLENICLGITLSMSSGITRVKE
ncbi:hypothetical protein CROQUDRAFT_89698 [Cronartium quercuum f. sp. fusiforme G11]|uniref:Uncharacterized protein n=1 Tax=Cronartium quercuum f. sp. fusiforme G11 TaxID=708437 RepID=A0A9P6NR99_9BASI|nr:hypothetical protein CROQUDRAFT_89698 [Cronartium quercuum f. sp. fusiforme G11]